jgi:hypothetical protein
MAKISKSRLRLSPTQITMDIQYKCNNMCNIVVTKGIENIPVSRLPSKNIILYFVTE